MLAHVSTCRGKGGGALDPFELCVCVCVCVCELMRGGRKGRREGERDREKRERGGGTYICITSCNCRFRVTDVSHD